MADVRVLRAVLHYVGWAFIHAGVALVLGGLLLFR
jgi:hypothetical protein